jgi:hypothetical protein
MVLNIDLGASFDNMHACEGIWETAEEVNSSGAFPLNSHGLYNKAVA